MFDEKVYKEATLYVPEAAMEAVGETDPWRNFEKKGIFVIKDGIEEIVSARDLGSRPVYDLRGVKVADSAEGLVPGLYISNGRKFIVR